MTNEQEIERMATIVDEHKCDSYCVKCKYYSKGMDCETLYNMESLVNAGIGDKKQAVKEAFDWLKNTITLYTIKKNDFLDLEEVAAVIDKVFTELYGAEE